MGHSLRATTILALVGAVALGACGDRGHDEDEVRIDFETEIPAFETVVVDSGPVEVVDGVILRTVTTYEAAWRFAASGLARGDEIVPIADTGEIALGGAASIELYATVTMPGYESDGLVGTQTFDFETNIARFDPFLVDDPQLFGLDIPAVIEVRFDPATGVGLAYVLEVGYLWWPTYEGKCLERDEEAGTTQYTMELSPLGDIHYINAVELVTPLGRDRLGEVGVDLQVEALKTVVDMGTRSLEDGAEVEGPGPCGA